MAPNSRWNVSRNSATVITGMANSSRNWVTSTIHVNTGIFINFMPGARMLRMVTIRLIAPVSEAMPVICRPSAQKSTPWLGEKIGLAFGWYMNQPPSGAPPRIHEVLMKMPTDEEAPEAERVDPREGDVTCADLQRDEVVGEAGGHRHHEEEHHRGGVHREHLVVQTGTEERVVRLGELRADGQRLEAADEEEEHRRDAAYMMPSFLWSTVKTHDFQPVVLTGRRNTPIAVAVADERGLDRRRTCVSFEDRHRWSPYFRCCR